MALTAALINIPDHPRRIAHIDRMVRDIPGNDAAGSNYRPLTDSHARKYACPCANPGILPDAALLCVNHPDISGIMVHGEESCLRPNHHPVLDSDGSERRHRKAMVRKDIAAEMNAAGEIDLKRRGEKGPFLHLPKE